MANTLMPGCYTVVISDANACVTTVTTCIGFTTNLYNPIISTEFNLYPNPTGNLVNIECNNEIFNYSVFNALGQLLITNKNNSVKAQINLTQFLKGIYTVEVEIRENKFRKKLIIN